MVQVAEQKNNVKSQVHINESKSYLVSKRFFDIIGSLIGLTVLSIVFLVVAIVIKLEDPKGPIFFGQIRVGKNEKKFKMYKFRSMVTDAESRLQELLKHNETTGAMFKMKNDPRVTKIGRFIRKTSIDELPQLWNVLKGDMSLVGPRPPLLREVQTYNTYQKQRLLIKPGCTGIWQVNGRSNIGFEDMVDMDLEYILNQSILLDLKIILKTFKVLLGSSDAY
ncbi:sugar transferase [Priestia flexa]|uniref:sugar transferase n=1 Tax=Priestia flexa TaxID=86664 RepID=UPI002E1CE1C5|nr:sugar transferase [Priestia flexa]